MRHHASVLVIESDPSVRASIAEALSECELAPTLADGLEAALAALSGGCVPDCILVDLDRAAPPAVVAWLHGHPEVGEVPVLALGSHPGTLLRAGADAVMLKPVDAAALPGRIAGICDCATLH
jgi:CheY-like chemotaxis protein